MRFGDRVLGSMLAGAVGDALGAPIEFLLIDSIRRDHGPDGLTDLSEEYGGRGTITDDTQMTLFTLEALIRLSAAQRLGSGLAFVPAMQHAYQRWYHTQGPPWERAGGVFATGPRPDGWLITNRGLFSARSPGATVMTALKGFAAGTPSGTPRHRLNDSKGCGAVMRAAPIALCSNDSAVVFDLAVDSGALTHSHPSGYLSAGAFAVIMRCLYDGGELRDAVAEARGQLTRWPDHEETDAALVAALKVADRGRPTPEVLNEKVGRGWVGEEALAVAVCAALVAEDLRDGLLLSVNHSGDSDSTGAVCGNLLGAIHGPDAIPPAWLAELELRDVTERITLDALAELSTNPPSTVDWYDRYPPT
ncbi:ADP-ribosylglycohydrolase [Herbihabitans rhizosphaerae]|uniref:ADP-ribosylglycohydrolase n=1 Tax=Herbihabitans rhizosphaerae TaxID=1872711 RepID=A0A4Q7KBB5_9PSEU|nr:ADP-ribosylglycohydrolase family protein [Herbihabitans rhizosphaerae]RZS29806.1 ADP-ribosylglycohydrolase [Herbihabitans rhizosphaerae]